MNENNETLSQELKNSDEEMPVQDTEKYEPMDQSQEEQKAPTRLKLTQEFFDKLNSTLGQMPYNTVLGTPEKHIKLESLIKFLKENAEGVLIDDMNQIINFIMYAPYNVVSPLAEDLSSQEGQSKLWKLF